MSLYFFASEKDEIKALVGIKALIIPFDIASKIREKLDRIEQNKQTLETEFKNCLEKEIHSEELKEEYNHFKCLNHSKVAKFFYVRNVMLRHTYNSCVGKKITGLIQSHPVLKDVLAYWIDYAYFHYVAFPIIEGAYLRHSQEEKEKLEEQVLYESRIKKFLMEKQGSLTAQEVPYRNIGRQLDRNFCLLLRGGRKVLEDLEFKDTINEKNSYFFKSSFLLFHMFASLLKRRAFWLNVGRALFKKAKFIYPHILARLLPGNDKKQTGGQLPSILSKEGAISPSGFY